MKLREISLSAVIAAIYTALVILLAPISYGPVQLRLADCLIPLSSVIGFPAVIGVTMGALLANSYWFLSPIDIIFGTLANFLASWFILKYRSNLILACVIASLIIGVIVGAYLWIFFPPPSIFGLSLPYWAAMMISISLSSLIAVTGIGYPLVEALRKAKIVEIMKSQGFELWKDEN